MRGAHRPWLVGFVDPLGVGSAIHLELSGGIRQLRRPYDCKRGGACVNLTTSKCGVSDLQSTAICRGNFIFLDDPGVKQCVGPRFPYFSGPPERRMGGIEGFLVAFRSFPSGDLPRGAFGYSSGTPKLFGPSGRPSS